MTRSNRKRDLLLAKRKKSAEPPQRCPHTKPQRLSDGTLVCSGCGVPMIPTWSGLGVAR